MRNTSLDEFLSADDADDSTGADPVETPTGDERGEGSTDDKGSEGAIEEAGSVEPAVSTYDWTPSGAACDECGETVERRWRDDPGMVCPDCKRW